MSNSRKHQPFMYSIDPDLYRRSHAPSSTIAMGMKPSQAATLCWSNQVAREQDLQARWRRTYDPDGALEAQQDAALQRTLAREAARRQAYLGAAENPELHTILYGRAAPDSNGRTTTSTSSGAEDTARADAADNDATAAAAASLEAELQKRKVKPSVKYLETRYDKYTVSQRFPQGPLTTNQTIGWAAAVAARGSGEKTEATNDQRAAAALYRPVKQRPAVLAYHKPEDDDHALLFGYDLHPK